MTNVETRVTKKEASMTKPEEIGIPFVIWASSFFRH